MSAPHDEAPANAATAFEGELTIYRAAELKPLMLAAVEAATDAAFDLSEVTEIDTAGVQLLLLARREAADRGVALRLLAPSPAVRGAFALLELSDHLVAGGAADAPAGAAATH